MNTNSSGSTVKSPNKKLADLASSADKVKKAPSKPRQFRCKECPLIFSSLKLRRQHPCDQSKNINVGTSITVARLGAETKGTNEDNITASASSSKEVESLIPSKPKKKSKPKATIKNEVILKEQGSSSFDAQYRISKTEPEDSAESRTNSESMIELSAATPYPSSTFDSTLSETPLHELTHGTLPYNCQQCGEVSSFLSFMSPF